MKKNNWIDTRSGIVDLAAKIKGESQVGIDTEFIRETTFYPKMALLQVAVKDQAYLVDPTVLSNEDLAPLLEVFKDPGILKVMHAAYADQECFYWAYGFVANPVLDTAVAGALAGYGDNVGLGKLIKDIFRINLPKGRARAKWLARPLSSELLQYAEQDVVYLVALGQRLEEQLKATGRWDWAMEESRVAPEVFEVPAEEMAWRVSKNGQLDAVTYAVLVELIRWREERARSANLPRGWVADNEMLLSLAKVKPTTLDEIRAFRGLNAKEIDRSGQAILGAVKLGKENPAPRVPTGTRMPPPTEREDHLQEFIRTYVSFLADRHGIALRYLINTNRAMWLARHPNSDAEEWIAEGILSRHACALIGLDLKELMLGRRALALKNGKVEILEV